MATRKHTRARSSAPVDHNRITLAEKIRELEHRLDQAHAVIATTARALDAGTSDMELECAEALRAAAAALWAAKEELSVIQVHVPTNGMLYVKGQWRGDGEAFATATKRAA
jgi:hypothetical protein